MGAFVVVLIIAFLIGCVVWNHRNAALASDGVEFTVAQTPAQVRAAIQASYSVGAKAKVKSAFSGVYVSANGQSFRTNTKIGDVGAIEVKAGPGSGAVVAASTTQLYVGSNPKTHFKKGIWGLSSAIVNGLWKMCGIAPNGGKMNRFQRGIEGRVSRQLRRAAPQ